MEIQLIQGQFDAKEALDLLTQLFHVKIKFHERKMHNLTNEEDLKSRESKIIALQKDLYEMRRHIEKKQSKINIHSSITLD